MAQSLAQFPEEVRTYFINELSRVLALNFGILESPFIRLNLSDDQLNEGRKFSEVSIAWLLQKQYEAAQTKINFTAEGKSPSDFQLGIAKLDGKLAAYQELIEEVYDAKFADFQIQQVARSSNHQE